MGASTLEKLPAIAAHVGGCLNCGERPAEFPANGVIAVGFGYAALTKNGQEIYSEQASKDDDFMTGEQAEAIALQDPDHDYRIVLDGPLSGRTYQRQDVGKWILIEKNEGFA